MPWQFLLMNFMKKFNHIKSDHDKTLIMVKPDHDKTSIMIKPQSW